MNGVVCSSLSHIQNNFETGNAGIGLPNPDTSTRNGWLMDEDQGMPVPEDSSNLSNSMCSCSPSQFLCLYPLSNKIQAIQNSPMPQLVSQLKLYIFGGGD